MISWNEHDDTVSSVPLSSVCLVVSFYIYFLGFKPEKVDLQNKFVFFDLPFNNFGDGAHTFFFDSSIVDFFGALLNL